MTIETKFCPGAEVCYIENGRVVIDKISMVAAYLYEDGTKCVNYTLKEGSMPIPECSIYADLAEIKKRLFDTEPIDKRK